MTTQQIIGQIRAVVGIDPSIPDADIPKAIKTWGHVRQADGIREGRKIEFERCYGEKL